MGLPNYYVTTLSQTLASGGSDTEIFVNSIQTADGQTISVNDFAIEGGTGFLIVDPQSSNTVEYISFSGVSSGDISFTGAIRGLSFKGDGTVITANKLFHSVGATVIIGWSSNDLSNFVNKYTQQTITGSISFTVLANTPTVATGTKSGNQIVSFADLQSAIVGSIGTASSLTYGTVKVTTSSNTVVSTDDTRLTPDFGTLNSTNSIVSQQGLQNGSETFAVATGSSVAYALSLSPALPAYRPGQRFAFYAPFVSGTAPTINVNGLGAKNWYKQTSSGTASIAIGDFSTASFIEVGYDGAAFQTLSDLSISPPLGLFKNGISSYSSGTGSQTIAHGLGVIPKYIRINANQNSGGGFSSIFSIGVYNGTTTSTIFSAGGSTSDNVGTDSTNIIKIVNQTQSYVATVTFDATNINLTYTAANGPASFTFSWEAFA